MSDVPKAASVLLTAGPGRSEVFLARRAEALRFFGGFWAFPGGKIAPEDSHVLPGDPLRAAAVRELFEETGVLLARRPDGTFPDTSPELDGLRRDLGAERTSFPSLLAHLGLAVQPGDLSLIGEVTTPAFAPIRFATTFFVAHLPPGQQPDVWPGELDQGRWATASDMLGCWERGECLVSPPTVMTLEAVRGRAAEEAPDRLGPLLSSLAAGALHPIWFSPDVQMLPLRTLGLPPSTHTNAYLVGSGPRYLLDPGPTDPGEQRVLLDVLDAHAAAGRRVTAVVLTHHHPDHVGAVNVCVQRYGVPVWAHPLTEAALRGRIKVTRYLHDGDRLDLGPCPDGKGNWHLEALHTPGHAPGHLAFYEPRYRLLMAGDMVSTLSSVVIGPPDGDLAVYLDSLRRLKTYATRLLLPAHGSASARPAQTLDETLAHRARREEQLVAALGAGARTVADLTADLYKGLPDVLRRFAELQTLAGLRKLQGEGKAEEAGNGEQWRLRRPGCGTMHAPD